MMLGVFGALAAAPFYWTIVPGRYRPIALTVGSLAVLAVVDPRLPVLVLAVTLALVAAGRLRDARDGVRRAVVVAGLAGLLALFVWNKRAGDGAVALASQSPLALLGTSYLVLKASALLVELGRRSLTAAPFGHVLRWLAFLPTYPAGPITDYERFSSAPPAFDRATVGRGLERVLFGAVKALVVAHQLGRFADPILAQPDASPRWLVLLALYATTFRFYLDFAGYSDIAIGLSAVYGVSVEENFDRPFARRNLVLLWQRWHMTLTRWLRTYLFVPVSRALLRRDLGGRHGPIVVAQVVTMTTCGLWHGLTWHFALWGLLHALGLLWVGIVARAAGDALPAGLVAWWRTSRVAMVLSTALTFNYFAAALVFVVADVGPGWRILWRLAGA